MASYVPDPSTARQPLRTTDVEELLSDASAFGKEATKVEHLAQRIKATIEAHRSQIQALNRDLQEVRAATGRNGVATTMSPRDAVRYLSPQELSSIVDAVGRNILATANDTKRAADQALRAASEERAKMNLALLAILEDPALPDALRSKAEALFTQVGGDVEAVDVNDSNDTSAPDVEAGGSWITVHRENDLGGLF